MTEINKKSIKKTKKLNASKIAIIKYIATECIKDNFDSIIDENGLKHTRLCRKILGAISAVKERSVSYITKDLADWGILSVINIEGKKGKYYAVPPLEEIENCTNLSDDIVQKLQPIYKYK